MNKNSIHIYNYTIWHKVMRKEDSLFIYMKDYLLYLLKLKKTPKEEREILYNIKNQLIYFKEHDLNLYINYIHNKRLNLM